MIHHEADSPEFVAKVQERRRKRMRAIDSLPPEIRALVHEYGFSVVKTAMDLGIKDARKIRHMVETVLTELSPARGSYSSQGTRAPGATPSASPTP